jgi:hypothetical protein
MGSVGIRSNLVIRIRSLPVRIHRIARGAFDRSSGDDN